MTYCCCGYIQGTVAFSSAWLAIYSKDFGCGYIRFEGCHDGNLWQLKNHSFHQWADQPPAETPHIHTETALLQQSHYMQFASSYLETCSSRQTAQSDRHGYCTAFSFLGMYIYVVLGSLMLASSNPPVS